MFNHSSDIDLLYLLQKLHSLKRAFPSMSFIDHFVRWEVGGGVSVGIGYHGQNKSENSIFSWRMMYINT